MVDEPLDGLMFNVEDDKRGQYKWKKAREEANKTGERGLVMKCVGAIELASQLGPRWRQEKADGPA